MSCSVQTATQKIIKATSTESLGLEMHDFLKLFLHLNKVCNKQTVVSCYDTT